MRSKTLSSSGLAALSLRQQAKVQKKQVPHPIPCSLETDVAGHVPEL